MVMSSFSLAAMILSTSATFSSVFFWMRSIDFLDSSSETVLSFLMASLASRRWLRMAYCTTCLDGPIDPSGVVLQWGDGEGGQAQPGMGRPEMAQPFVISGQAWGESNLIGRPAIFDLPQGAGHVVAFNFNPLHRDLNRGDQRMLWNAIINWRAILTPPAAK